MRKKIIKNFLTFHGPLKVNISNPVWDLFTKTVKKNMLILPSYNIYIFGKILIAALTIS